ncbi:trans-sialidase, partial [Trypanosoma cruzi]
FSFYFDGCVLPPCVIVEVGAVPHVSLLSSCASCCADVTPCVPLLFCFSSTHKSIRTVLCRIALDDGGTLAFFPFWHGETAAFLPTVGIPLSLDGFFEFLLPSAVCWLTRLHDARCA